MNNKIVDRIQKHNGRVYLTVGFRWKHPTILDRPVSKEVAIKEACSPHYALTELDEKDGKLYLTCYTANDMW